MANKIENCVILAAGFGVRLKPLTEEEPKCLTEVNGNTIIFIPGNNAGISDIIGFLAGRGIRIEEAIRKETSLEELYSAFLSEEEKL